ncbi:hypothetical protein [Halovivax sp.]|uniref:DUF7331 family protein n=1 Tax=Halovivax sp. TaxID=1935978 RepID=UPI0025BE55C8|nr:hypothetical protein [Halovivax sp.]
MDHTPTLTDADPESLARRFDEFVEYADGDATVICDRSNASAWIRSTAVRQVRR